MTQGELNWGRRTLAAQALHLIDEATGAGGAGEDALAFNAGMAAVGL